jgi:hypothetical protein
MSAGSGTQTSQDSVRTAGVVVDQERAPWVIAAPRIAGRDHR